MTKLTSLSHLVPQTLLAPAKLNDLIDFIIDEVKPTTDEIDKLLEYRQRIMDLATLSDDHNALVKAADKLFDDLLSELPADKQVKVKKSDAYKYAKEAVSVFEVATRPISEAENVVKPVTFDEKHTQNYGDQTLSLGVNGTARFALYPLDAEAAGAQLNGKVIATDTVINQEAFAKFALAANAKGQLHAINVGIDLSASGELEIDTYYQTDSSTSTARALWAMYSTMFKPWDLSSMQNTLVPATSQGAAAGHRMLQIRTQSKFGYTGTVGIGKSLSFSKPVNSGNIDVDISAAADISHEVTLQGDMRISLLKTQNDTLQMRVEMDDKDTTIDTQSLSLNASIKGLDGLVRHHVERILGRGDTFFDLLEDYSKPGTVFAEKIKKSAGNNTFKKTLAQLLLGETSSGEVIDDLLLNSVQEEFDKTPLSPKTNASELAKKLVADLIDRYGINTDDVGVNVPQVEKLKSKIEKELAAVIKDIQGEASGLITQFKDEVKAAADDALAPLTRIGQNVRRAITKIDAETEVAFDTILTEYNDIKKQIADALDKAANVQLAVEYKKQRKEQLTEQLGFTIDILKPEEQGAAALFRAIVIGDDKKVVKLLPALEAAEIVRVPARSIRLNSLITTSANLSVNLFGIGMTSSSNVSSELDISVDPSGAITISNKYAADVSVNGREEYRQAIMSFSYGYAASVLSDTHTGSFGVSYINGDKEVHRLKEINFLLNSLDINKMLSNNGADFALSPLVPEHRRSDAMARFSRVKSDSVFGATKSEFRIALEPGLENYQALRQMHKQDIADIAIDMLLYVNHENSKVRDILVEIRDMYAQKKSEFESNFALMEHLIGGGNRIQPNTIKNDLKGEPGFDDLEQKVISRGRNTASRNDRQAWKMVNAKFEDVLLPAKSLTAIPSVMEKIDAAVAKIKSSDLKPSDGAPYYDMIRALNEKMRELNAEMEVSLDKWLDVSGIWNQALAEWMPFDNHRKGINLRMLGFLFVLREVLGRGDNTFMTTIDVTNNADKTKTIIV